MVNPRLSVTLLALAAACGRGEQANAQDPAGRAAPIAATSGSGAHLLADRISTAHYTPDPRFADGNGREGPADAETIDRLDIGRYRVSLPNVAPSASSTAQATGFGADDTYATIESWVGNGCGGTYVNVRTYSAAGVPTDAPFSLLYLTDRPAAAQEVAWAWVDPAGQGATFTPWAPRQFSTSGTPITVTRDLVQRNKFIVNFHGFTGTGGAVHASAYGGAHTAVVNTWFPYNNEIRAVVELSAA